MDCFNNKLTVDHFAYQDLLLFMLNNSLEYISVLQVLNSTAWIIQPQNQQKTTVWTVFFKMKNKWLIIYFRFTEYKNRCTIIINWVIVLLDMFVIIILTKLFQSFERFKDAKGVIIRSRKSKDRQHNDQKKKDKRTKRSTKHYTENENTNPIKN